MNATMSFDGCSADGRWRYIMCPRSRHGGGAEEQISGRLLGRKHDDRFAGRQRSDQSAEGIAAAKTRIGAHARSKDEVRSVPGSAAAHIRAAENRPRINSRRYNAR